MEKDSFRSVENGSLIPALGIEKKKLRILHGADMYMPFHLP
jgi:hypothetical protein